MSDILWHPDLQTAQSSALARFATKAGFDFDDYAALHRWSVSDLSGFWGQFWDFAEVIGDKGSRIFEPAPDAWMTGAEFFPDARINLAENFLRLKGNALAIIEADETGHRAKVSAAELHKMVARVAEGLRAAGVSKGDRVGTVMPNRIEALVTLLATASLGAVWTSCSPDFGAAAILDRIGQVRPKVLFVQPVFTYGGKKHDISNRIDAVADQMEGLANLVVAGESTVKNPHTRFDDFGSDSDLRFERVGFNDPVYVMYTSGTTGAPKAIVHRTGGVTINQMKEHILHADTRPGDAFLWYSNTAWMMYHWLAAAQSAQASVALYDGAPIVKRDGHLDPTPLWQLVEEEKLTHLGISPKYLSTLSDLGFVPRDAFDTTSLRWLLSSGSPMAPFQYDWMYETIGDMGYASISGGTDLMGCFLLGNPTKPVRRGTLTCPGLGMSVAMLDDRNAPVTGRPGELCCTEPFPSMPLTFWGDDGDARYRKAYFAERPEIWTHGDRATMNADGSSVIHGRSDFTLNPGGVRIGTADIYNVCEQFDTVEDCVAFGRAVDGDEEIVLCVVMAEEAAMSADLARTIRSALREFCSPRHVPAAIYSVTAVPYTLNSKRVEGAAKAMASGNDVKNKASMLNPECLDEYATLKEKTAF